MRKGHKFSTQQKYVFEKYFQNSNLTDWSDCRDSV